MHSATTAFDPLLSFFWEAVSTRGWCKANSSLTLVQNKLADGECLFRMLLNLDHEGEASEPEWKLSSVASRLLQQVCEAGISLHLGWPRSQREAVDAWLGRRFFFSASTNFAANERYVSLVSSQLGRHGSKLPNWPALVDAALQNARRDHERPLILPGTSLSEATQQFSNRADLSSLTIQLNDKTTIEEWLNDLLSDLEAAHAAKCFETIKKKWLSVLKLSPPERQTLAPEIDSLPIQDRVAFALADRVIAIYIRSKGTIANLAERRLTDERFPRASVYIASTFGEHASRQPDFEQWLERGAVGWLLQAPTLQHDRILVNCHNPNSCLGAQSLCFPMPAHWSIQVGSDGAWPFLTHCTRGNSGPSPNETVEQFRDRAWSAGAISTCHPLSTLQQILNDARIKGNTRLTRSQAACVSFSEVPLAELLSRRQFRSHLGRWDWEPYGILVRRDALEQLGARRVVYGDEADYKQLADEDKPYFQPRGTKNARSHQDWTSEREWRFWGDLSFAELPRDSILVFVATKTEAQQVARHCQWPVVWVGRTLPDATRTTS
ncbi:MAG: hypothetical protein SFV81_12155 [Pirellulaceae bacterium]|nr:hypothetical protein [Pirellulaceae bacterium]